ncbi:MAG TPA: oxalurate catabolism protein HpxZ [Burkholderiaceae bacterium]|nr:oxalurate catabolism protein HpxZ [Burkholderiaceae bacterium]
MHIDLPEAHAELSAEFARYEDALVNNRLDVLDALFWPSERTVRYGVAENLYGIEAIRAFRASRPAQGLARTVHRSAVTTYGRDHGTTNIEFVREGGTKVGRQSQTWVRFPDLGWRIVSAHVSLMQG